jgi:hypothetical protein
VKTIREDLYRYSVRSLGDLAATIVPFFEAYPLRTAKRDEFSRFAGVVRSMGLGVHLTVDGSVASHASPKR